MVGERSDISPQAVLRRSLSELVEERGWPIELLDDIPTKWEKRGDLLLLANSSFHAWRDFHCEELWQTVAAALRCSKLALKGEIEGPERRPSARLLLGEDGRVEHREHSVIYRYDVTRSMFSAGNLAERGRMGELDCRGENILDLYAGIGYYTLPLLVRANALHVHACEWSSDAVASLRENLTANGVAERCTVHEGDNRLTFAPDGSNAALHGTFHRVVLGLLPSGEEGLPMALDALGGSGGILHLHGIAAAEGEEEWADDLVTRITTMTMQEARLERLVKVKWYSPHTRHCVADIHLSPR